MKCEMSIIFCNRIFAGKFSRAIYHYDRKTLQWYNDIEFTAPGSVAINHCLSEKCEETAIFCTRGDINITLCLLLEECMVEGEGGGQTTLV
jgi:hypothetical protein